MDRPSVQQQSDSTVLLTPDIQQISLQAGFGFRSLLSETIRLVVAVSTLLWFHALAAAFERGIRVNVDSLSRV